MSNIIQADPKLLKEMAEKVGALHASLSTQVDTAKAKIISLKGVWTGPAAASYQTSFLKLYASCAEALKTVSNMKMALISSAAEFTAGEATVQKDVEGLPTLKSNLS